MGAWEAVPKLLHPTRAAPIGELLNPAPFLRASPVSS
jgi:hypothetical protein